eukprot:UN01270
MSARKLEIVLTNDVDGLGRAGDLVKVRPGRARNHLFPMGAAVYKTQENIQKLAEQGITVVQQAEDEEEAQKSSIKSYPEAQGLLIRNMQWTFHRETVNSADNHVVKPVTKKEILNRLRASKFSFVHESDIVLTPGFEELNHLGKWPCAVALHCIDDSAWVHFDVTLAKPLPHKGEPDKNALNMPTAAI